MQATGDLADYLIENGIVAIEGVDTRALVQHIRSKGAMNGIISTEFADRNELKARLAQIPSMNGLELSSGVSTREAYTFGSPDAKLRIAVLDFGLKRSMLRNFDARGVFVKVFPGHTHLRRWRRSARTDILSPTAPETPRPCRMPWK